MTSADDWRLIKVAEKLARELGLEIEALDEEFFVHTVESPTVRSGGFKGVGEVVAYLKGRSEERMSVGSLQKQIELKKLEEKLAKVNNKEEDDGTQSKTSTTRGRKKS